MNIHVRFVVYEEEPRPYERLRRELFQWEKTFSSPTEDEAILEQALGYILALYLVKPMTASILVDGNGFGLDARMVYRNVLQFPPLRQRLVGVGVNPPRLTDTLPVYAEREHFDRFEKTDRQYALVTPIRVDDRPAYVIQFNNLEFLQGFISILEAFHAPLVWHIVTIYGPGLAQYTIRQ
jgi:hypothetical protein